MEIIFLNMIKLCFVLLFFFLMSCTKGYSGYGFNDKKTLNFEINKETKEDIRQKLGDPTIEDNEFNKFYYISQQDIKFLFIKHANPKRKYLILTFNKENVLTSVDKF